MYTSKTRYQKPNTHSNDKLQQRHPKVPKGPDQVKKVVCINEFFKNNKRSHKIIQKNYTYRLNVYITGKTNSRSIKTQKYF